MTSHTRTRYVNASRHISRELNASAAILDAAAETATCTTAAGTMRACALEFRRLSTIVMGDIGEPAETEEYEIEPLYTPVPQPVEVPA